MKPGFLLAVVLSCCLGGAPALAAQSASGSISAAPAAAETAGAAAPAPAPAASSVAAIATESPPPAGVATPEQQAALAGARPAAAVTPMPAPSASGSLLQTVFALALVLGVLVGLAWLLKRYGPKNIGGNGTVRLVGALSVGARERILVVEVGEQWIVVGASPGRMNALATMPRQEGDLSGLLPQQQALPNTNFAEWFKQTIEKRNGK
ncbi:MAG: flagellar biosynthetic protein FliO [Pseudomonadota bacterium]